MGVADPLLRTLGLSRLELVLDSAGPYAPPAHRLLGAKEIGLCARELLLAATADPFLTDVQRQHRSALKGRGSPAW